MTGRPVRGGCGRQLLAAALLVLLVGCSGGGSDSPESEPDPDRPIATGVAVQPLLCGGTTVLSEEQSDTGTPATEDEMLAHVLVAGETKPGDFMTQTVAVDEGFGSFSLAAPQGFSAFWRAGTPPDILLELAEPLDEEWAAFWEGRMLGDDTNVRAIMVDGRREDGVSAVQVTLTEAYPQSGDDLADRFAQDYTEGGATIGERCGIRANGSDGAYVEHRVPGDVLGSSVDRTQIQFLIPDEPNELLLGVTCDVPEQMAAEVKDTCREIASTFRPLPAVAR
jgi:hypothetical protein